MKLRRIIACLLLLTLLTGAAASAETTIVKTWTQENAYVDLNVYSGNLIVESRETRRYTLYSPEGTPLTTEPYIYMRADKTLQKVAVKNETNMYGYIDRNGQMLVPMQYGDLECLSERWQLGVVLKPGTAEQHDYKSFGGDQYFLVDRYDAYYQGQKVGELGRMDFDYGYAYGAYLYVRNEEGDYVFYDSQLKPSPYQSRYPGSSEYEDTRDGIFHRGSGQRVGVPGCTLKSDDVSRDVLLIDGRCVDLQGNVIFALDAKYEYVNDFRGDYASVRANGFYGLIDRTGREVIPCEYESISYGDEFFEGGYQVLVKNGKIGFANEAGEITSPFKYGENTVKSTYRMPITHLIDLDGSIIVLGAEGELAQRFVDVRINSTNGSHVFVGQVEEDKSGVFDLHGNEIIPADGKFEDPYDLTIANDGRVVLGQDTDRVYHVFILNHGGEEAEEEPAAPAPADDGSWVCTCGASNTTKFCPNCGSGKPEAAKCVNCGYEPAAGENYKFCPECGSKF